MLRTLLGPSIRLTTTLDPGLDLVRIDRCQIAQALINLTLNARDAMPAGGTLTIATTNVTSRETAADCGCGAQPQAYVALTVRDTGVGMDEATQARLFEPFFTTKAPGHGTGLGLAMCKTIVTQHGGTIAISSAVARGTTVSLRLPRASQTHTPDDVAPVQASTVPE